MNKEPKPRRPASELARKPRKNFLAEKLPDLELSSQQQFLNMLPTFLQQLVAKLPSNLFDMSEKEISDRLFGIDEFGKPNPPSQTHQLLRQAIWDEYDRCIRYKERLIDITRVVYGICTMGYFANRFCGDDLNIVYLINPPTEYLKSMKEILQLAISNFREIMLKPNDDPKIMEIKVKIAQHIDLRVKGAIIQRIDQRNVNLNFEADAKDVPNLTKPVEELNMFELDAKIKELESKSLQLSAPTRVDVNLMKPATQLLDADEETHGLQRPDLATRHRVVSE